jgi:glucosamine--fructose-6-phosphate aminotransferase (isomerizing)
LEEILDKPDNSERLGIGHTRWATHGKPNSINAHPHPDYTGKIAVVHNGIIENYGTLKTWLKNEGAKFASETDTEVIANLIGYFYDRGKEGKKSNGRSKFEWSVQQALGELAGTYGLAIVCCDFPDTLIGAKKGSPLILGVGENEEFKIGKAYVIREGKDVTVFAHGYMVSKALMAAESLEKEGLSLRVVNVSTLKPIDEEAINDNMIGIDLPYVQVHTAKLG